MEYHHNTPQNHCYSSAICRMPGIVFLIIFISSLMINEVRAEENNLWKYEAYLDIGYGYSFNNPENNLWRSKSTTNIFGNPRINMALGYLDKKATLESPWGMEFGIQAGVDADNLIPSPPPEANEPRTNADLINYLYRANASYRIPVGNGLKVSAGLINSFIAFESYLSLDNSNYTRGYITDNVPYFFIGAQAAYPLNEQMNMSLFVVDGWNYLAKSNHSPSYGFQVAWEGSSDLTLTQNLYYGPEQNSTDMQYWRFFFDSIVSWKADNLLLALSIDGGTEKQADQVNHPRYYWFSGAVWATVIKGSWQLSIRPEFYNDSDGVISGANQTILAVTTTIGYNFLPESSPFKLIGKAEYRYDRSTGREGGFYQGSNNNLVPTQNTLFLSLVCRFGSL